MRYLSIDTSSPNEYRAFDFLKEYLSSINFEIEKQCFHPNTYTHELFTPHKYSNTDSSSYNLKAINNDKIDQQKSQSKVLFNIHIDVVPNSNSFPEGFSPIIKNNYLYGRGACDTKNNLIMLVEAIRFLKENNIPINKQIEMDLVIEEEITGNGTLSSNLHGIDADVIIVMEPTNLQLFRGHRGVITAEIEVTGKPVHMGSDVTGVNAIEGIYDVIKGLKVFEQEMLEEARLHDGFNCWDKPLQINVGKIEGGQWAGSVPENCKILANVGFTDKYTLHEIQEKIRKICTNTKNNWVNNNISITFNELKNAAYLTNENDSYLNEFLEIINSNKSKPQHKTYGWRVSCDAHYYHTLAKKPTLIFGSGDLSDAHSSHEKVDLEEFKQGVKILAKYLVINKTGVIT